MRLTQDARDDFLSLRPEVKVVKESMQPYELSASLDKFGLVTHSSWIRVYPFSPPDGAQLFPWWLAVACKQLYRE